MARVLILVVVLVVAVLLYPRTKHIEHRSADRSSTRLSGLVSVDVLTLNRRIRKIFDSDRSRLTPPFDNFIIGADLPDSIQLRAFAKLDPFLAAYAGTTEAARQYDVYVYDPLTRFWASSEYYYRGVPAPFLAKFIVHLTPVLENETSMDILEFQPQIQVGKYFGWSAHTGLAPGLLDDLRWVAPSTTERKQLLEMLAAER